MALADGLFAYYQLEDDWTDAVGSKDLNPTSSPVFFDGHLDRAAAFGGYQGSGASSAAHLGDNAFGMDGQSTTIAGWFFAVNYTGQPGIVSNWSNLGGVVQWLFWHNGTNLTFQIRDGASSDHAVTHAGAAPTGAWTFFACRYNTVGGTIDLRIGTTNATQGSTPSVLAGTDVVGLGNRNGTAAALNGALDAVGFWGRVLSNAELDEYYNGGVGLQYPFPVPEEFIIPREVIKHRATPGLPRTKFLDRRAYRDGRVKLRR